MKDTKILFGMLFCAMFCAFLFLTQTPLGTVNYAKLYKLYYILVAVEFIVIAVICSFVIKIRYATLDLKALFLIIWPYAFIMVVSIFQLLLFHEVSMKMIYRGAGLPILLIVVAYGAFLILGSQMVDYIWLASCINYSVYVLVFVMRYGVRGLLHFVEISAELERIPGGKILEVHEVTFIFGLLLIYYICRRSKKEAFKIIISGLFLLLGYKRILFLGVFLAICVVVICRNESEKRGRWIGIGVLLLTIGWLVFVLSPYYEKTAAQLGIELNGRSFEGRGLYGRLNGTYSLSPLYLGHGVGFVDDVMMEYKLNHPNTTTGFHNDILKYYIDLGFLPSMALFGYYTVGIEARMKKRNMNNSFLVLSLVTMTFICWMTDNLASYPNYEFVFSAICLCTMTDKNLLKS